MTKEFIEHETEEFEVSYHGDPAVIASADYSESLKGVEGMICHGFKAANDRKPTLLVTPIKVGDGHFRIVVSSSRMKDDKYGIRDVLAALGFLGQVNG